MNKRKKIILLVILILVMAFVIPVIINEFYKTGQGYITVWSGADVLAFYGAIISAIGSIVLGIIAWQQNNRIVKIEEQTFLTNNVSAVMLNEIKIKGTNSTAINFGNHTEQILGTKNFDLEMVEKSSYGTIEIECKLDNINSSNCIAFVKVNSLNLFAGKSNNNESTFHLFANGLDNEFSGVAISKDYSKFVFTLLMTIKEKNEFIAAVNSMDSKIMIDLDVSLVNNEYIQSNIQCRANLSEPDYDDNEKIYNHFKISSKEMPICFWKNAEILQLKDFKIKETEHM